MSDYITLKWGTLKSWNVTSDNGRALLKQYAALGSDMSGMLQHDTDEQKRILCDLIDEVDAATIYLEWDGKDVTKNEAKTYVMGYGKQANG